MKSKGMASLIAASFCTLVSASAFAQNAATEVQRNIDQQRRIEQGLKSGALTTREAGRLEREESRVEKMETNAMKDGSLSDGEKRRIDKAQDKVSREIRREKHDAQRGDPNSASSRRLQADVQRNINQQSRIEQGIQSGQMSNREIARAERGQAQVNRAEARAGADGHVSHDEQRGIQMQENRQSRRIHREKHNDTTRD